MLIDIAKVLNFGSKTRTFSRENMSMRFLLEVLFIRDNKECLKDVFSFRSSLNMINIMVIYKVREHYGNLDVSVM